MYCSAPHFRVSNALRDPRPDGLPFVDCPLGVRPLPLRDALVASAAHHVTFECLGAHEGFGLLEGHVEVA